MAGCADLATRMRRYIIVLKEGAWTASFYGISYTLRPVQPKRLDGFPLEKETEFDPVVLNN